MVVSFFPHFDQLFSLRHYTVLQNCRLFQLVRLFQPLKNLWTRFVYFFFQLFFLSYTLLFSSNLTRTWYNDFKSLYVFIMSCYAAQVCVIIKQMSFAWAHFQQLSRVFKCLRRTRGTNRSRVNNEFRSGNCDANNVLSWISFQIVDFQRKVARYPTQPS